MVYHICNRTLFRGFHSDPSGRKKIVRPNGKTVKGDWLTGQLVEVPMKTPPGATPRFPLLCLGQPGERLDCVSDRTVYPDTISQFSGTYIETEWEGLTKTVREAWLREHCAADWKGVPVFEGDIFWDVLSKTWSVAVWEQGPRLVELETGDPEPWEFSLKKKRGDLWTLPKGLDQEDIQRFHAARRADAREEALSIAV